MAGAGLGGCAPADDAQGALAGLAGPPASATLEATFYETRVPAAGAGGMDAAGLAASAATPAEFHKTLAGLGPTRVLYQVCQTVSLASESQITVSSTDPMVTATQMTDSGKQINTIQYERVGVVLKFVGKPRQGDARALDAKLTAELSTRGTSAVEIVPSHKASTTGSVQISYGGEVWLGRPFVVIGVTGAAEGKGADSVAYVCRVLLSRPGAQPR